MARVTDIELSAQAETEEVPCHVYHPEQPPCLFVHHRITGVVYSVNGKVVSYESYTEVMNRLVAESEGA